MAALFLCLVFAAFLARARVRAHTNEISIYIYIIYYSEISRKVGKVGKVGKARKERTGKESKERKDRQTDRQNAQRV